MLLTVTLSSWAVTDTNESEPGPSCTPECRGTASVPGGPPLSRCKSGVGHSAPDHPDPDPDPDPDPEATGRATGTWKGVTGTEVTAGPEQRVFKLKALPVPEGVTEGSGEEEGRAAG